MTDVKTWFDKDIAEHKLTVIKEDGVYRHIRCQRPGTWCYGFDIITWPGYLAYAGDMGEFVFKRLNDMFDFFRGDRIDLRYWAEKCLAGQCKEFDIDTFRVGIIDCAKGHLGLEEEEDLPEECMEDLFEVLHAEDEYECVAAARDFSSDKVRLDDWYEHSHKIYTHRFEWCCYALQWAIKEYDARSLLVSRDQPEAGSGLSMVPA